MGTPWCRHRGGSDSRRGLRMHDAVWAMVATLLAAGLGRTLTRIWDCPTPTPSPLQRHRRARGPPRRSSPWARCICSAMTSRQHGRPSASTASSTVLGCHLLLGRLAFMEGRISDAELLLQAAVSLNAGHPEAHLFAALCAARRGFVRRVAALHRARAAPHNAEIVRDYGAILLRVGQPGRAAAAREGGGYVAAASRARRADRALVLARVRRVKLAHAD